MNTVILGNTSQRLSSLEIVSNVNMFSFQVTLKHEYIPLAVDCQTLEVESDFFSLVCFV